MNITGQPEKIYVTPNGIWECYGTGVDYFFKWEGDMTWGVEMECIHV